MAVARPESCCHYPIGRSLHMSPLPPLSLSGRFTSENFRCLCTGESGLGCASSTPPTPRAKSGLTLVLKII